MELKSREVGLACRGVLGPFSGVDRGIKELVKRRTSFLCHGLFSLFRFMSRASSGCRTVPNFQFWGLGFYPLSCFTTFFFLPCFSRCTFFFA